MFTLAFIAVSVAILLGLAGKIMLDYLRVDNYMGGIYRIAWLEFTIVALLMMVVITPGVLYAGKKLSVNNIVTYQQFLNGVETKAVDKVRNCYGGHSGGSASSGDSNCDYTYMSGTYTYETVETESYSCTGSDGKPSTCTRPKIVSHTGYIYTPYAKREHRFTIESSFGFKENKPYHFGTVYLDKNPEPYGHKSVPGNLPRGAPADWLDAKKHLDAGDPRPVTAIASYSNYVLAADDNNLHAYSTDIARFKDAGLLSQHTAGIMSDPIKGPSKSQADKLSFVGVHVADSEAWQRALMRYNAAFGMKLQGDLHVVLVDAAKVPDTDSVPYLNALKAYWQGPTFKKRALAKNGVILAIGVDNNSSITWAQASTGMPFGNENMEQHLHDFLPRTALTPSALFGEPRTVISGSKVKVTHPEPRGVIEKIMFDTTPFARASMSCENDGDGCIGFKDLLDTIEPTTTQKIWMVIITTFLAIVFWVFVGMGSFVEDVFNSSFRRRSKAADNTEDYPPWQDPYDLYRDRDRRTVSRKGRRS